MVVGRSNLIAPSSGLTPVSVECFLISLPASSTNFWTTFPLLHFFIEVGNGFTGKHLEFCWIQLSWWTILGFSFKLNRFRMRRWVLHQPAFIPVSVCGGQFLISASLSWTIGEHNPELARTYREFSKATRSESVECLNQIQWRTIVSNRRWCDFIMVTVEVQFLVKTNANCIGASRNRTAVTLNSHRLF